MRTILTILIAISTGVLAFSQSDFPEFEKSLDKRNVLRLNADLLSGSDHLILPFAKTYYNSGFLNQTLKEKAFDQLGDLNHVGAIFGFELSYEKRKLSNRYLNRYTVIAGHEDLVESRFDRDLFGLYFFGNKRYENKTAEFDDINFNVLRYQYLKVGADRKFGNWVVSGQIGLASGQEFRKLEISKGSLFIAEVGKSLDLDLTLKSVFSDQEKNSVLSLQGIGLVSDWGLAYQWHNDSELSFGINRLGIIHWNDGLIGEQVDTNYYFDGLAINNLFDSIYVELKSEEALEDEFLHPLSEVKKNRRLPFLCRLNYHTYLKNRKIFLSSSIVYMPKTALGTYGSARISYQCTPWLWAGVAGGFGIYSAWNLGVSFSAQVNGFRVDLDSSSLVNWMLSNQIASVNGQIRVSKYF